MTPVYAYQILLLWWAVDAAELHVQHCTKWYNYTPLLLTGHGLCYEGCLVPRVHLYLRAKQRVYHEVLAELWYKTDASYLQKFVKGHLPAADGTGLTALQPLVDAGQVEVMVALRQNLGVLCKTHMQIATAHIG